MKEKERKESHERILEKLDEVIRLLKKLAGEDVDTKDSGPDQPPPKPPGGGG